MADTPNKKPWLVGMHYRMRTVAFAMMFVASALHSTGKSYSPGLWLLLVLLFLVYPHLQYYRACRAPDPLAAEMHSLLVDSVLLGLAVAALGFPLWITFSAFLGTISNNTANMNWRGVVKTLLAFPGGALAGCSVFGFNLSPDTGWPATFFCIAGLTGYLVAMGNISFTRIRRLRLTREALMLREAELMDVNRTLHRNFQEIDVLHDQLREQANRDALTGLFNRRYLDSTLDRELARCKRDGQPLALIMIDIDHFKQINDTYGHQAGDEILLKLGTLLAGMARAGDVACRYGGEEFLLLIPTMPLDAAVVRAGELRTTFGEMVVPFGEFRLKATLSIGVSAYPGHGVSAEELIRHADKALYRAKHGGRNRVEIWIPKAEASDAQ
jgi:diguanylate cyclase (GGDEF)-like protein